MSIDITTLLDEREITRSIFEFARAMDAREWDELHRIMTPDATAELGTGTLRGPAEVVASIRSFIDECGPTQHLLGNLTVKVNSEGVSSQTSIRASHRGSGSLQQETYECMGYYRDTWQQTPAGWRISHRAMVVNFEFGSRKVLGPKIESH